jgi:hypothetical protein
MSNDHATLRHIAWREVFPWLHLVRAVGLAMRVRLLCLATLAVFLTIAGWAGVAYLFSGSDDPAVVQWREAYGSCPWKAVPQNDPIPRNALASPLVFPNDTFSPPTLGQFPQSPYYDAWWQLSAPFRQLFSQDLTYVSLAFVVLCGLWVTIVGAFFGGAITRIATMQIAREEQISLRPALKHARQKFLAYFSAPLLPLVGVLLVTVPTALLGLLMRSDVGLLLAGLVWPLVLVGGLLMGIFLLGLFFGWPLMWGAISTEGSDSFDALSRSYSYVYQRPYHYLFYALVATFLGLLGGLVAYYFASAVIHLTLWAASWGTGTPRSVALYQALHGAGSFGTVGGWGVQLIGFWTGLVKLVAIGFVYSYFWTASTAIYLLLRYQVDGTELDEVFLEEGNATHGLPTLATDSAGVPVVPPDDAPASSPDASAGEQTPG